jgi:hypothetical protein
MKNEPITVKSGNTALIVGLAVNEIEPTKRNNTNGALVKIAIKLQDKNKDQLPLTWPSMNLGMARIFSLAKNDNYAIT